MVSKQIIAIAIVAILIVSGVGVAVILMNGNNDEKTNYSYNIVSKGTGTVKSYLVIYGNANNDNYLDNNDVKFIQDIVDGKATWNKDANPYADANFDSKITTDDVNVVKDFIAGKETEMYYVNWDLDVQKIKYPLTGDMCVGLDSWLDGCMIMDVYDKVKYVGTDPSALDENMYPNAHSLKEITVADDYSYTYEAILATGCSIVLGENYNFTEKYLSDMKNSKTNITNILLPIDWSINNLNWVTAIITITAMMNNVAGNEVYQKYCDHVAEATDMLNSAIASSAIPTDNTYAIAFRALSSTDMCAQLHGTSNVLYGDVATMEILPVTNVLTPQTEHCYSTDGYVAGLTAETFITGNPDIMILEYYGTSDMPMDEWEAKLAEAKTFFGAMDAVYIGIPFEVLGAIPGPTALLVMASYIWPGSIDLEDSLDMLMYYYNTFTNVHFDNITQLQNSPYCPVLVA